MAEAFVKGLVVALFLGFISLIRYFINWLRYRNREKLLEEDEKHSFLEKKFKHLITLKEGKNFQRTLGIRTTLLIPPREKKKMCL